MASPRCKPVFFHFKIVFVEVWDCVLAHVALIPVEPVEHVYIIWFESYRMTTGN